MELCPTIDDRNKMQKVKRHLSLTSSKKYMSNILLHPLLTLYFDRSQIRNSQLITSYFSNIPSEDLAVLLMFLKFNKEIHSFRIYSESSNFFDV